jgi:hypothetical protein
MRTMAKSDLLRVNDVRAAYRLIGDCRDLGSDPALWIPHMLEGLAARPVPTLHTNAPANGPGPRLVSLGALQ